MITTETGRGSFLFLVLYGMIYPILQKRNKRVAYQVFTREQYDERIRMLCCAEGHIRLLQEKKRSGEWTAEDADLMVKMLDCRESFQQDVSVIRREFPSPQQYFYDLPFQMEPGIAFTASYYPRNPFSVIPSGDHFIAVDTEPQELPEYRNGWDRLHCLFPDSDHPATRQFYRDNYVLYVSPTALRESPDDRLSFQYLYRWDTGSTVRTLYTDRPKEEETVRYEAEYEYEPVHDYWKEKEEEAVRARDRLEDWFEKTSNKTDYDVALTDQEMVDQRLIEETPSMIFHQINREWIREEIREKIRKKAQYSNTPPGTVTGGERRLTGYREVRNRFTVNTKESRQIPAGSICYGKCAVIGACNGYLATIFVPKASEIPRTRALVNYGSSLLPQGDIIYTLNNLPAQRPDMKTIVYKLGRMFGQFLGDYDRMGQNTAGLPDDQWRIWNEGVWAALNDPRNR